MNAKAKTQQQRIDALLELHVAHALDQCEVAALRQLIDQEIAELFQHAQQTNLNDWVSKASIIEAIERNVIKADIPGAVTEIAGEASARVLHSQAHRNTLLGEIMDSRQLGEFIDELLSMNDQRQFIFDFLIHQPIYGELVSHILFDGIASYLADQKLLGAGSESVKAVLKFGQRMINKTAPKMEHMFTKSLHQYVQKNVDFFVQQSEGFLNKAVSDQDIKDIVLDFWDAIESKTLGEIQQGIDTTDLSDLIVLGYEFWLSYRQSEHFFACCQIVLDYVYEKYGDSPLSELLDDLNIDKDRIMTEFDLFAPDLLKTLRDTGFLEALIRKQLESFYYSDAVKDVI